MDVRRPGACIWLNLGCGAYTHNGKPRKRGLYPLSNAFASAVATPTCMADHEFLKAGGALVEEDWKWMWLR